VLIRGLEMAKNKVLDHPISHSEIENEDRIIFLVVGVAVTIMVFIVMKVLSI
jgi:hypothetical protein